MRPPSLLLLAGLVVAGCAPAEAPELAVGEMAVVVDGPNVVNGGTILTVGRDAVRIPVGAEVKVLQLPAGGLDAVIHVEAGLATSYGGEPQPALTGNVGREFLRPGGR